MRCTVRYGFQLFRPLQAVRHLDELNGKAFVFWSELLEASAKEVRLIRVIFAAVFGFYFTLRGLRLLRLLRERDRKPKFGLVWERNKIEHDSYNLRSC